VLLLIAEGHRWPIAGAHNPALLVGRLVASVGTRAAPKRVIFRAATNLANVWPIFASADEPVLPFVRICVGRLAPCLRPSLGIVHEEAN